MTSIGLVPVNDLGTGLYLGQFQGGLYPNGSNELPPEHLMAGLAAAGRIVPRDVTGAQDPTGQIVLISVGMSNTAMEFCGPGTDEKGCAAASFMGQAATNPAASHATLAIVNGAKGEEQHPRPG